MKPQLAKMLYESHLEMMKRFLRLGEFKFRGKEYAYFREETMGFVYEALTGLFKAMESEGVIKACKCGARLRGGKEACPMCGGSGYCNVE